MLCTVAHTALGEDAHVPSRLGGHLLRRAERWRLLPVDSAASDHELVCAVALQSLQHPRVAGRLAHDRWGGIEPNTGEIAL